MQQEVTYEGSHMENTEMNLGYPNQPMNPAYYPGQAPPQMYPQPMGPAPGADAYNQNAFAACNQGIANGFGAMYFNIRDPNFTKTNTPVKQGASLHLPVVIFNAILYGCAVVAAVLTTTLGMGGVIGIMVGSYLVYLLVNCCCSDIKDYIHNMKRFDNYQQTYNQMTAGKGFFRFWIECYHYVTVRTKRGTSRRKVVTHTATQIFSVPNTVDQSGQITSIQDVTSHVFIHYLKRYYFTDDKSQNNFINAFNSFVARNRRDVYQNYTQTFDIQGFEEYVAYSALGPGNKSMAFFYVFTLLGLGAVYCCIYERTVSRYDVGILKRLTI